MTNTCFKTLFIHVIETRGLCYKNMMIVNDTTSWSSTLDLSITLLDSSIMFLEQSTILLENNNNTSFTHNRHLRLSFTITKHL